MCMGAVLADNFLAAARGAVLIRDLGRFNKAKQRKASDASCPPPLSHDHLSFLLPRQSSSPHTFCSAPDRSNTDSPLPLAGAMSHSAYSNPLKKFK